MTLMASDPQPSAALPKEPVHARLAVAWQNPESRLIVPIGLLTWDGEAYGFRYLRNAASIDGFRPLLGFPAFDGTYASQRLFPLFAQRIINSERPDYGRFLTSLDLESTTDPWEVLGRSEGRREGDSILVFPEPHVSPDGTSSTKVLVHGIRHRQQVDLRVEDCLNVLTTGDALDLVDEPENPSNPRAVLVADSGSVPLGYVPDLLLDYLSDLRASGEPRISVARINPPWTPPHLRFLISIEGLVNADYVPFDQARWASPPQS